MKLLQGKYRALEKDEAFKDLMAAAQTWVNESINDISEAMSGNLTQEDLDMVRLKATQKKFRQETLDFLHARLKNSLGSR